MNSNQIRKQVYDALANALGADVPVSHFYPESNGRFPSVSFYEAANAVNARFGGVEMYTDINYQIDIWALDVVEIDGIHALVDKAMSDLGFSRTFSYDMREPNCMHKTMRYSGIVSADGFVYQR